MSKIDIGTVLKQFDDVYNHDNLKVKTFGIRYITARGHLQAIHDARKNVKNPKAETTGEGNPRGKQKYNLKRHGCMKLYNEHTEEYRDIKVAHMIEFRPHNSQTWIPIFH